MNPNNNMLMLYRRGIATVLHLTYNKMMDDYRVDNKMMANTVLGALLRGVLSPTSPLTTILKTMNTIGTFEITRLKNIVIVFANQTIQILL